MSSMLAPSDIVKYDSLMSWLTSERYELRTAPAGLALVQELINTRAIASYAPDLLAERESAQRWLSDVANEWARVHDLVTPDVTLTAADPAALRGLRATFGAMAHREETPERPRPGADVTARLDTDAEGQVIMVPVGSGARWLEAALWSETLLAQRADTWRRLKVCRNPECASAFYDTSRNNSGVWHNVRTCGNAANLRASRERRRARG